MKLPPINMISQQELCDHIEVNDVEYNRNAGKFPAAAKRAA